MKRNLLVEVDCEDRMCGACEHRTRVNHCLLFRSKIWDNSETADVNDPSWKSDNYRCGTCLDAEKKAKGIAP